MDQFAWDGEQSVFYMGLLMSVGAVVACITFILIGPLCKRFDERRVTVWGGFFFMVIGRVICIPWGPDPPLIAELGSFNNETMDPLTGKEKVGCPSTQDWCRYTPRMTVLQFVIGYSFTTIGYPLGVTLIQTIFSKVLGPRPQGVWMGLMTGAGCASRVLGPVFVGLIYTRLGIYHTFGITGLTLLVSMLWLGLMNKRLVPVPPSAESYNDHSHDNKQPPSDIEIPLVQAPLPAMNSEKEQQQHQQEQNVDTKKATLLSESA